MLFYLFSVIMLSRLYPLFRDEAVTVVNLIVMMVVQLFFLLVMNISSEFLLLVLLLFIADILEFFFERKSFRLNLTRFLFFLIFALISMIFSYASGLNFSNEIVVPVQDYIQSINNITNLNLTGMQLIIILTGLFILLNESNFLIRLVFELSGKVPVTKETREPDKTELNAGRIIGILERIIIFFFVTIGQFAAVGFVIAAKGVVRYKELEDRNFAEYVLIGTLLSSLLAIFTGFIAAKLLM